MLPLDRVQENKRYFLKKAKEATSLKRPSANFKILPWFMFAPSV